MFIKSIALIVVVFFNVTSSRILAQQTPDEAFRMASETNKPVLLVFSGSDWCAPCIRFEKEVLSDRQFIAFAESNLIVLKADFPQRKSLPKEVELQNARLADKLNPKGIFPYILLVQPEGTVKARIQNIDQSPTQFIDEIKRSISDE